MIYDIIYILCKLTNIHDISLLNDIYIYMYLEANATTGRRFYTSKLLLFDLFSPHTPRTNVVGTSSQSKEQQQQAQQPTTTNNSQQQPTTARGKFFQRIFCLLAA